MQMYKNEDGNDKCSIGGQAVRFDSKDEVENFFRSLEKEIKQELVKLEDRIDQLLAQNSQRLSLQIDSLLKLNGAAGGWLAGFGAPAPAERSRCGLEVIKTQEADRRRLAQTIQDGPAEAMVNIIFLTEVCEKLMRVDADRAGQELRELQTQARDCLEELRKIIFDLWPLALEDLGLVPMVKKLANAVKERAKLSVSVKVSGVPDTKLAAYIAVSLFRVIQACLTIIETHSHASEAQILIEFQAGQISVSIKDNGSGFDAARHTGAEASGLAGMKERISLLGGELKLDSRPGGTEITVRIPLASGKLSQ
jgi:two-component system sensor histidine kinase DegS